MKRFTLIKKDNLELSSLIPLIKELIGFSVIEETNEYLLIKHNYINDNDINDLLISYSRELLTNIVAYNSTLDEKQDFELNLIVSNLKYLTNGIYNIKSILTIIPKNNTKEVLEELLSQTGITIDFIKDYVKYDLNISKASKGMYIHRNTMNYKLDKLKSLTSFDLRKFNDAYILYNLIMNM